MNIPIEMKTKAKGSSNSREETEKQKMCAYEHKNMQIKIVYKSTTITMRKEFITRLET